MILIGFTCTGTFQLWLNCAQNFAKENVRLGRSVHHADLLFRRNSARALIVTALAHQKDQRCTFHRCIYPVICLLTTDRRAHGTAQARLPMTAGAFLIGWAGAGGLLQIATSVCNMLFPKIKGTVTALVMIASSLCNYTILFRSV